VYGFNPWNEDQKARICSHLKREFSRLTDLFERDAAARGPRPLPTSF
jgi:hypothetical protein